MSTHRLGSDSLVRLSVLLILWYLAITHTILLLMHLPPRAYQNDFSVFYTSAVAIRHGIEPYTANLKPIGNHLGMYIGQLIHSTDTPSALLFFIPFSLMQPATAFWVWLIVNGAAFIVALILMLRPKYSGLSIQTAYAICALALLYAPVTDNFIFSQRQTLVLLLLVLVIYSIEKDREAAAGLILAAAIAYRAFPVFVAGYFVVRRQWRMLGYVIVGLAVCGVLTIVGLGVPVCVSYLNGMRFATTSSNFDPADVALRGFTIRMFACVFGDHPGAIIQFLQYLAIATGFVLIIAVTARVTARRRCHAGFDRRSFGLWVAVAVVLSPLSWIHYMILLLIPFAEIVSAAASQQCSRRALRAAIVSFALIGITFRLRLDLIGPIWWARGVRYLAEGSSIALLIGFMAAYWLASDDPSAPRLVV